MHTSYFIMMYIMKSELFCVKMYVSELTFGVDFNK